MELWRRDRATCRLSLGPTVSSFAVLESRRVLRTVPTRRASADSNRPAGKKREAWEAWHHSFDTFTMRCVLVRSSWIRLTDFELAPPGSGNAFRLERTAAKRETKNYFVTYLATSFPISMKPKPTPK